MNPITKTQRGDIRAICRIIKAAHVHPSQINKILRMPVRCMSAEQADECLVLLRDLAQHSRGES